MATSGIPVDWTVVVAGAWNLAILTPAGIARRLFGLQPDIPVEVQVPIDDRLAPIHVRHEGILVAPSPRRLLVAHIESGVAGLVQAARIAAKAVKSLPETPMSAAGVNVRYRFDAMPDRLLEFVSSTIDERLAEADLPITDRSLKRTVKWQQGLLNLEAQEAEDASGFVAFNFHLQSTEGTALCGWIERAGEMVEAAVRLLTQTMNVSIKEANHD